MEESLIMAIFLTRKSKQMQFGIIMNIAILDLPVVPLTLAYVSRLCPDSKKNCKTMVTLLVAGFILPFTRKRKYQIKTRTAWHKRCIRGSKKRHQHSGRITETIFIEISKQAKKAKQDKRRISVSGMLKILPYQE